MTMFDAQIIQHFLPDGIVQGLVPIGNGNINDTKRVDYLQKGTLQSAILQRLNHRVFKTPQKVMDNLLSINRHLNQQDAYPFSIPDPLQATNGQYLWQDEAGNFWRMFPYLADSYAPEGKVGPDIAYAAARAYGLFSAALCDFPAQNLHETIPGFHDTDQRWRYFEQVLSADPVGRVAIARKEIEKTYSLKPLFDHISHLKTSHSIPVRVTHNDTKAGNVLFHKANHKVLAVIDLDTVMPGVLLSDFGDMVRTFVPDMYEDDPQYEQLGLQQDVLDALLEGFLGSTSSFLTPLEKDKLMMGAKWICGEQALRFLSDFLAGDVYYKVAYEEHNWIRAKNQLQLVALLP
jgi:Ser/Thr protein kinase RdoA (MazF antagonist)